ncbi:MAG: PAS domain-containing protein, partial [Chitinivibrionales bacterium]|nr:PAS domain-containing protein [Chitinivibrionales bacterium]
MLQHKRRSHMGIGRGSPERSDSVTGCPVALTMPEDTRIREGRKSPPGEAQTARDDLPGLQATGREMLLRAVLFAAVAIPVPPVIRGAIAGEYRHALAGGAVMLFAVACLVALRFVRSYKPIAVVFLCFAAGMLAFLLSHTQQGISLLFWALAYPLGGALLLGANAGAVYNVAFLLLVLWAVGDSAADRFSPDTTTFLFRYSFAYLSVSTIVHFYERSRRSAQLQLQRNARSLAESSERYRRLFELSADGVLVVDRDGVICDVNASAISLIGCPKGRVCGQPLTAFLADEGVWSGDAGGSARVETDLTRADGSTAQV